MLLQEDVKLIAHDEAKAAFKVEVRTYQSHGSRTENVNIGQNIGGNKTGGQK